MLVKSFALKIWIVFLTFAAGFVNVAAVRVFSCSVSHHTGNVTRFAVSIAAGECGVAVKTLSIAAAFFIGAFVSGLMFHQRKLALKKRYGIFLLFFSLCFFVVSQFNIPQEAVLALLAFIAGMQNGMFIYYGDILVRTTHLTGYLTDAAFALGMAVRGDRSKLRLAVFYLINIFCFIAGGTASALIHKTAALSACGCIYGAAGIYYFILRHTQ